VATLGSRVREEGHKTTWNVSSHLREIINWTRFMYSGDWLTQAAVTIEIGLCLERHPHKVVVRLYAAPKLTKNKYCWKSRGARAPMSHSWWRQWSSQWIDVNDVLLKLHRCSSGLWGLTPTNEVCCTTTLTGSEMIQQIHRRRDRYGNHEEVLYTLYSGISNKWQVDNICGGLAEHGSRQHVNDLAKLAGLTEGFF